MVLPMNTGAEGVETALKLARKWGYEKKRIPKDEVIHGYASIMIFRLIIAFIFIGRCLLCLVDETDLLFHPLSKSGLVTADQVLKHLQAWRLQLFFGVI